MVRRHLQRKGEKPFAFLAKRNLHFLAKLADLISFINASSAFARKEASRLHKVTIGCNERPWKRSTLPKIITPLSFPFCDL